MYRKVPQEAGRKEGHRRRVSEIRQIDSGRGSDGSGTDPETHTCGR
jgi:hypothetical protein